jgi:predicted short-subunit dehydrogenase-like oxidoreductase (DUF2520 family)
MIRVVLIGAGNVAVHLARALEKTESVRLVQHFSRTERDKLHFSESTPHTNNLDSLVEADVYLIAVKDEAIEEVSGHISAKTGLVLHTSGSIPMKSLKGDLQKGVLYPVQTFSKDRELNWKKIPLALEASSPDAMALLRKLASSLSDQLYEIDSTQRKKLHLSAVFANNFSNHMFALAEELCEENQLDFELLKPLISETGKKVMSITPEEAQTGPARRHDYTVMEDQANELNTDKKAIYKLLSKSISSRYRKNET